MGAGGEDGGALSRPARAQASTPWAGAVPRHGPEFGSRVRYLYLA